MPIPERPRVGGIQPAAAAAAAAPSAIALPTSAQPTPTALSISSHAHTAFQQPVAASSQCRAQASFEAVAAAAAPSSRSHFPFPCLIAPPGEERKEAKEECDEVIEIAQPQQDMKMQLYQLREQAKVQQEAVQQLETEKLELAKKTADQMRRQREKIAQQAATIKWLERENRRLQGNLKELNQMKAEQLCVESEARQTIHRQPADIAVSVFAEHPSPAFAYVTTASRGRPPVATSSAVPAAAAAEDRVQPMEMDLEAEGEEPVRRVKAEQPAVPSLETMQQDAVAASASALQAAAAPAIAQSDVAAPQFAPAAAASSFASIPALAVAVASAESPPAAAQDRSDEVEEESSSDEPPAPVAAEAPRRNRKRRPRGPSSGPLEYVPASVQQKINSKVWEQRKRRRQRGRNGGSERQREEEKEDEGPMQPTEPEEQLEDRDASDSQASSSDDSDLSDSEDCYCQKWKGGWMVKCEAEECAHRWFHLQCLGLESKPEGAWFCPEHREQRPESQ